VDCDEEYDEEYDDDPDEDEKESDSVVDELDDVDCDITQHEILNFAVFGKYDELPAEKQVPAYC
jgi:hypothetical protein